METPPPPNENIESTIRELVAKIACCHPKQISARHDLKRNLGFSSLDQMELMVAAEHLFDIELSDSELASVRSVADVIHLFTRRLTA